MSWFDDKEIKELREEIEKLNERVYKLENPFEFEIGETVYFIPDTTKSEKIKAKILDRY